MNETNSTQPEPNMAPTD